ACSSKLYSRWVTGALTLIDAAFWSLIEKNCTACAAACVALALRQPPLCVSIIYIFFATHPFQKKQLLLARVNADTES
ncbi:hypothetical protein, partial [Comamonas testosteroni]|uniref:hypothetical protein n=1 Tax=Comamonas testosteroni TaxID=285 RepID=UPI001E2FD800